MTATKVKVFGDIYPMKYMGKQYFWKYEISAVTKLTVSSQNLC